MKFITISTFLTVAYFFTGSHGVNSTTSISVSVQLRFTDLTNENVIPAENVTAAYGTTAFQFLQLAAQQNPCYLFQYITYAKLGHYITTICCVAENTTSNFYWFVYINNTLSPVGVDGLIPNNGDILRFEYRFINFTDGNHTQSSKVEKQDSMEMISVSVKLTFTNYPNPNVVPPVQVNAANGTIAFDFLQLASQRNPCYLFNYKQFSIGRYINTICCVEENKTTNFYWFIYLNGKLSPVGADLLKPKNGDTLTFEYQKWENTDHTPRNVTPSSTPSTNTTPTGKGLQLSAACLNIFISVAFAILASKFLDLHGSDESL